MVVPSLVNLVAKSIAANIEKICGADDPLGLDEVPNKYL
jgi:hypothetical protein